MTDTDPAGPAPGQEPAAPGQQEPGQQQPGQEEPGQQEPGQQEPGQQEPGQEEPGQQQPVQQEPGQEEPVQQEPGMPGPAEDPGYLTETGEAAGEDGSVVPIIGGLPAAEGSAWDIGAPRGERGAGLAEAQGGSPDQAGHEDTPGS